MGRYTILLIPNPQEGGYTVKVPVLPGCMTEGETAEECVERAKEAIAGYIESLEKHGEPVPEEKVPLLVMTIDVTV